MRAPRLRAADLGATVISPHTDLTHVGAYRLLRDTFRCRIPNSGVRPELLDIVTALADPHRLTKLIWSAYDDPAVAEACATKSFQHPLGFNKITLIDAPELFTLRLHVWWPMTTTARLEHVHNHRFGFSSAIVCGGYEMRIFEPADTGQAMTEYHEEVSAAHGWRLRLAGETHLRTVGTLRLRPGSSYSLPAESFHQVNADSAGPCITLFLQTAMTETATRVFVAPGGALPVQMPKQPFGTKDYRRQLELVLAELSPKSCQPAVSDRRDNTVST
jgi:hypothetical protein